MNDLEYRWIARVPGDSGYGVGFLLFKLPIFTPGQGTFAELLRRGQASLMTVHGHREQVVRGVRPALTGQDSALIIELRNPTVIGRMFANRPSELTIEAVSPYGPLTRSRVGVRYEGW